MKILCVGDIHAKPWVVHAVALLADDYDRIIFLGDYVDDWGANATLCRVTLGVLFAFYKQNKGKVVLLRGNHDFSEYYGYTKREFMSSGFNIGTHNECHSIYKEEWQSMQTVHIIPSYTQDLQDYWISHAGITSGWYKQWGEYWDRLTFEEKSKSSLLDTEVLLAQVGSGRGGSSPNPSPIWADKGELVANPKPFVNQIVGHTPVRTITCHEFRNGDGSKNRIFFCDTFSTYRDGTQYGDCSCLSLDTEAGTWAKIYPLGEVKK